MVTNRSHLLLVDRSNKILGRITVERAEGNLRLGTFTPIDWPTNLQALFHRYDTMINEQILSALDAIEDEIDSYGFGISAEYPSEYTPIFDLQITHDNRVSFRLRSTP